MSDVKTRHFWRARDIVDRGRDQAELESGIAHAIADAREEGRAAGYAEAIEKAAARCDEMTAWYAVPASKGVASSLADDIRDLAPAATTEEG